MSEPLKWEGRGGLGLIYAGMLPWRTTSTSHGSSRAWPTGNAWRYDNPRVRPDLSKATLSRWILGGINLRNADLSEADLSDANLSQSDLSMATLRGANLSRAILVAPIALGSHGAAVITGHGADFSGADLTGASSWERCSGGWTSAGRTLVERIYRGRPSARQTSAGRN
jgi:hypothetical protein